MSNSESELTHASILQEARAARDGLWIEKILAQVRESMCGTGFADQKDIPEKLKTLPNLTGPASYPAWEAAVNKLTEANLDGKQLIHLETVLCYLEENIPLPPIFNRLPQAEFRASTATEEKIQLRAAFEAECRARIAKEPETKRLDFEDIAEDDDADDEVPEDYIFPVGTEVQVHLYPDDKKKGSGKSKKQPRWVQATVMDHDRDKAGATTWHLPSSHMTSSQMVCGS